MILLRVGIVMGLMLKKLCLMMRYIYYLSLSLFCSLACSLAHSLIRSLSIALSLSLSLTLSLYIYLSICLSLSSSLSFSLSLPPFDNKQLMSAVLHTKQPRLSPVSAALFEDTGWYVAQYNATFTSSWGRGRGCDFVNAPCLTKGRVTGEAQAGFFCDGSSEAERRGTKNG
jgi:hypothetical protein